MYVEFWYNIFIESGFFCSLKVSTLKAPKVPLLRFLTHPAGQGVVYNVIVRDPNNQMEAAYSPAVSYGCHDCQEKSEYPVI